MSEPAQKPPAEYTRIGEPRVNVLLWEEITFLQAGISRQGFIRNIGRGGMFIEAETPFEKNSEIEFSFMLKNPERVISGRGRVAWVRAAWGNALQPPGMGVEILEFRNDSGAHFSEYFEQCLKGEKSQRNFS